MTGIADFNDADRWIVQTALKERYGHRIEGALAESEIRLDPAGEVTVCSTFYWFTPSRRALGPGRTTNHQFHQQRNGRPACRADNSRE